MWIMRYINLRGRKSRPICLSRHHNQSHRVESRADDNKYIRNKTLHKKRDNDGFIGWKAWNPHLAETQVREVSMSL